ncbi:MAG: hypothetical protein FJW68_04685 [Actinobacteria bacterium]|nr:hypothetical protein [Actinomycetota bacterium]
MIFRRKKTEKPKSQLGLALFNYDKIYNSKLKSLIRLIDSGKNPGKKKTDKILDDAFIEMNRILNDISKTNFKTDYRSDKIRDNIINIINTLKDSLGYAKSMDYDYSKIEGSPVFKEIDSLPLIRENIRKKMQDIESDYT